MSLLTRWLESLADKIEINDQCLREISPFSRCEQCVHICPENALEIDNGKIVVHEKNCTVCGKCMTTCPAYAIEGTVPFREVLKDTLIYQKGMPPSVREWLFYYQKGVRFIAITKGELNDQWQDSLKEANHYLEKMSLPFIRVTNELPEKEEKGYTRRQLFQQLTKESKSVVMKSFTPAKWRFNNTVFSLNKAFPDWNFYEVTLDENKCHLCEVCFKTCPQQVFSLEENELQINLSACTGCGLCVDVCQEEAVTVKELIQPAKVVEQGFYKVICPSCNIEYNSWEEKEEECFICTKRKSSFYLK